MMTGATKDKRNPWGEYAPQAIEARWQRFWEESGIYVADQDGDKPKYYCLDFFPYPSGEGLHVGHCRNYIPTDLLSRFMRMRGYNVLHPMGWDSFGEPTEQYAVSHGVHPRESTDKNTANFRRQMNLIGASYDWSREIDSSEPSFYRWTQWFFLLLYKRGLAYRDTSWQWWCPTCQTTISSHEATGGVCWRGHAGITKREIPAWYFKITAYADELIKGLDDIDWPEKIKSMQRNWIGRSEGYEIEFDLVPAVESRLAVFTTRPDTLYGATFLVLAPEHPWLDIVTSREQLDEVKAYQAATGEKSEVERMLENREKTGVFTGCYATNPINGETIPVWTADYILPGYGTGAVMGVPAHDQRDFEFARRYGLAVRPVIFPSELPNESDRSLNQAYQGEGFLLNSGPYSGMSSRKAIEHIGEELVGKGVGRRAIQYRIRDWLISRQRYWGTPIPIVYCADCGVVPVPEAELPVLLPKMEDFLPDGSGRSPLARVPEFVNTACPTCGGPAQRETDTMGGFACSSWYFLRFTSPEYNDGPFEEHAMRYWMPVDLYVGGAEHAVLHLLYSRFWIKVLADAGLVPFREPFSKLLSQGHLMGLDGVRMSKTRGNVITPDQIVEIYGADALRIYVVFLAPFEQDADWNAEGINGAWRFLNRIWNLYADVYAGGAKAVGQDIEVDRRLHQTIRQVTERIQSLRLNTMVSVLMEFVSFLNENVRKDSWQTSSFHAALDTLLILLAPAAPHLCEELWRLTGHQDSVHQQLWPSWDPELAKEQTVRIAIQVDGRLRDVMEVPVGIDQNEASKDALSLDRIQPFIAGREIVRTIYVPAKVLNIITRG